MRIAICDDVNEHIEYIKQLIAYEIPYAKTEGFTTTTALYDYIKYENPEIVIIDIVLDEANGIEAAKRIHELDSTAVIIFVSGYADEYIEKVYEVNHIYMVKKPINKNVFKSALKRAIDKVYEIRRSVFEWSTKKQTIRIPYSEILYFESEKHNVKVITQKGEISIPSVSLNTIEGVLNADVFIRCHQSFIANITNYKHTNKSEINYGSCTAPISRRYSKNVTNTINRKILEGLWKK